MKRIVVTGPESTGKSQLASFLASKLEEPWAPEYARKYLSQRNGTYSYSDLAHIAEGQHAQIDEVGKKAMKFLISDTDAQVVEIWSAYRFGKVEPSVQALWREQPADLYLLCFPDLPWESDLYRESPNLAERQILFEMYEDLLIENHCNYCIIRGTGDIRLETALQVVCDLG